MQLTSIILTSLLIVVLCCAILFAVEWHRTYNSLSVTPLLREGIGHIGVSVVVEYPSTTAPLFRLLEERYPRSEAIMVVDMQQHDSPFGTLIQQFRLVKVNHSHLKGVRALYRSRHRAYRRIVVIDLPATNRQYAAERGREVATYDYILYLQGESLIAHDAITYCANIIARHHDVPNLSLQSLVGATARLERASGAELGNRSNISSERVLAWGKRDLWPSLIAIFTPAIAVVASRLTGEKSLLAVAVAASLVLSVFLYVSTRVMTEKGLLVTLDTILRNFYRYLVRKVKNFNYLYKGSSWSVESSAQRVPTMVLTKRDKTNLKQL